MSTVQATPAAVYNETVIMNTKDEQREEAEMNPADRQSKRTVEEDEFSSDSESGVSDSDMSQSDMSDNEDVEIKKEHFGEPISLRNVTSGEGNRSEEENEWSDEEVTKRVDSEEENEWSDEEPVQRRVRSVSFSDEAPLVRLESCDSVESENMGVSRPPSVEFDSAETSPNTTRSAPVDIPTRNTVDTAKATPKHVSSTEVSPKHVDTSDIESARKQIAEQEDTIEMLRDRIRQLEMQKTDSKPTTTPRSWAKAKPTQSQCPPEPVNRVSTTKSEQQDEPYRRMSIDERMEKFSNTESKVMTSVERPLDAPVDVSEKKDFWKSASESSKTVQTSVPRPLEAEAATAVNVQEKKTFWRSASQTEKEVVTSVPRPLDCAVDVKQKRKSFHEAMSSEFTPVREAIKEAVEVNEKKAFWTKAAEAEKEVVTSTPRPLDCAVDLKEKRKSFHEASQSNFTPVREALKEATEVNEKKAFWTKAAEADKEVVTSSARPLDCPVDIKEKRKSFHEASQSNFTPVRPVITDVAEVNEKKAFWNKAAETEKEVVTSSARPLDCPVDMKGKMSEYTEATRTSHVKKNSVDVHDAEVNEKKNFWIKAAETEKEVVTSSARPLDCPVDVKSKMSEYTEASKEKVEEREVSSNKGSIRMKTATECCDECTKTLYFTEKIVADNKNYHKSCFKCTHCGTVLKLGNYAGLNGKIYCKPHFKQLFASKGNYNEGFGNDKLTAKWTNKS